MTSPTEAVPSSNRELVLTRLITAPREKVFKAWTDPELLSCSGVTAARAAELRGTSAMHVSRLA